MDAIPGLGPAGRITQGSVRTAPRGGGFSVPTGGNAAASGAAAPVSMAGLLALQEAGGDEVRDRDARRRGRDLLDELAGLQRELLAGYTDPVRLTRLADLAATSPHAADPRLRDVVQAIVLRARVEAARYGTA
jgi:hypothetical protein